MAVKSVRVNSNSKSFKELAKQITSNAKKLKEVRKDITREVGEKGAAFLWETTPVGPEGIDALSGEIRSGITLREGPNSYTLEQVNENAKYLEYGTGSEGKAGVQNPDKPSYWSFNSGRQSGKRGYWTAPMYHNAFYRKTHGQKALMLMYNTKIFMRENRLKIAKKYVRKVIEGRGE